MSLSVLTIVRGRKLHLRNQFQGLLESASPPAEWIVVGMGETPDVEGGGKFPIRIERISLDQDAPLPLAAARNLAAQLAKSEGLLFLDVDCIPASDLIDGCQAALSEEAGLWMGSIGYLPPRATRWGWTFSDLDRIAVAHPALPEVAPGSRCHQADYCYFWSLCFAIPRRQFWQIGGFDESFRGYGAEDTDFSFTCRKHGIPFGMLGHKAYHQHHAVYKPPLNHFDAIVLNARRFREKWQSWPMQSWLKAFAERGLIEWDEDGDRLDIVRPPSEEEVASGRLDAPAGFSPPKSQESCLAEVPFEVATQQADLESSWAPA